jgi:hypothetical protein
MAEQTTPTERAIRDREKRSRKAFASRTRRAERQSVLAAEEREALLEAVEENGKGAEPKVKKA